MHRGAPISQWRNGQFSVWSALTDDRSITLRSPILCQSDLEAQQSTLCKQWHRPKEQHAQHVASCMHLEHKLYSCLYRVHVHLHIRSIWDTKSTQRSCGKTRQTQTAHTSKITVCSVVSDMLLLLLHVAPVSICKYKYCTSLLVGGLWKWEKNNIKL